MRRRRRGSVQEHCSRRPLLAPIGHHRARHRPGYSQCEIVAVHPRAEGLRRILGGPAVQVGGGRMRCIAEVGMTRSLGYFAQLAPPPSSLMRMEEKLLASLLRLPYRALPWAACFRLQAIGGLALRSAEAAVRAAEFRYAWACREKAATSVRPMRDFARGRMPSGGDGLGQPSCFAVGLGANGVASWMVSPRVGRLPLPPGTCAQEDDQRSRCADLRRSAPA